MRPLGEAPSIRLVLARLLGAAGLALGGACVAPGPAPSAPPPPPPPLAFQDPSWEALEEIERWLGGSGPDQYPESVAPAELALAEGRLAFAERDAPRLPDTTLRRRLASAETGFRRVLGDDRASVAERRRAEEGLARARALRSGATRPLPGGALAVHDRSSWRARAPLPALLTPHRGGWTRVTVHHSAPPDVLPLVAGTEAYHDEIRRIQRYHMDQASPRCGDIGYHFLIDPRGEVYEGRSLVWQGAHSGGANNRANIGVCLLGDYTRARPTPAALASLERLLDDLTARYRIPRDAAHVLGHGELKATACPGGELMAWVRGYRARGSGLAAAPRSGGRASAR